MMVLQSHSVYGFDSVRRGWVELTVSPTAGGRYLRTPSSARSLDRPHAKPRTAFILEE
jgi:hypothetical protein